MTISDRYDEPFHRPPKACPPGPKGEVFGKAVCDACGTSVEGLLSGTTACPKCQGELRLQ